jgi:cyclophilin family peptidyl-prolyl cis-trans isomerase
MSRRSPWFAVLVVLGCLSGCGKTEEAAGPVAEAAGSPGSPAPEGPLTGRYPGIEAASSPDLMATPLRPQVVLKTSAGDIRIRLEPEKAPATVENFLNYVEDGHYDGTIFHEIVDGYMILGGSMTAELRPKRENAPIRNESHNGLLNKRGTIAMARQSDVVDSSTCQFFINLSDNPHLDHKSRNDGEYGYCVFGEVIEGMEVLDKIAKGPVKDEKSHTPEEAVAIRAAIKVRR